MATADNSIHAIGRRKTSIARVYLKEGSGAITVNKLPHDKYFDRDSLRMIMMQPLVHVDQLKNYDIIINVKGGGKAGQAGAVRLGISRALQLHDSELRGSLKKSGFLSRDPRAVERKKYGRHKARKKPQFSKR